MAKKRKSKPKPKEPAKGWSYEDTTSLLAWLDFTLKHKDFDFRSTVVERLKNLYSFSQIEGKLFRLWDAKGPVDAPRTKWKDDLYTRGSSFLDNPPHGLSEDEKEDIQAAIENLEDELAARSTAPPQSSRTLRSSSRIFSSSPSHHFKSETPRSHPETPQARKRRFEAFLSTSLNGKGKQDRYNTRGSPLEHFRNSKRQKTYSKRKPRVNRSVEISTGAFPLPKFGPRSQRSIVLHSSASVDGSQFDAVNTLHNLQGGVLDGEGEIKESIESESIDLSQPNNRAPSNDEEVGTHDGGIIRCVCGATEEVEGDEWIKCDDCKVWQHTQCVKHLCEQCGPRSILCKAKVDMDMCTRNVAIQTNGDANPSLDGALTEIRSLTERLAEKEDELKQLQFVLRNRKKDISILISAKEERDKKVGWPVEEHFGELIKKIHTLNTELNSRSTTGTFTRLLSTSRDRLGESLGETKVVTGFRDAYARSQQTLTRHNAEKLPFVPSLGEYETLRSLVLKLYGSDLAPNDQMQQLSTLNPQAVIRALITSALHEWVFGSDFPPSGQELSPTLAKYRELLGKQDGALALRNLDLAVLASLMKEESFREKAISAKAEKLAFLLSRTLAPLFSDTPGSPSESGWNGFSTWRQDMEEWRGRQDHLTEMFNDALKTKADSCLNILDYEMVIYHPGIVFDANTMDVETTEGMRDPRKNHTRRVVRLCIEAAVFAYPREAPSIETSVSNALIPTKNFVEKTASERVGMKPLVKAVVILSDEN